jgi:hypothetical protein
MKITSISVCMLFLAAHATAQISFQTPAFLMEIDASAQLVKLIDRKSQVNYAPATSPGALVRLRDHNKQELLPTRLRVQHDTLHFEFSNGVSLYVKATEKATHLRFELVKVMQPDRVDAILWGPMNTTISDTIGEVVGVVRNPRFAIGLQSLNPKTVGGKLQNDDGSSPGFAGITGATASPESFGSALQAFCMNAGKARVVNYQQCQNCHVPPIKGYTLEGSAIALFGVETADALPTLGEISLAEGLPYQKIDDQWIRMSPRKNRPYLITGFTENNFDEMLDLTKRLGFHCVYHEHPFKNWGHFELIENVFPSGRAGLKACVEKARAADIIVGVHTLSNFITTNDPFVTTVANSGLQSIGAAKLVSNIEETTTEIPLDHPVPFDLKTTLNCVRIGAEIIRYQEVSKDKPFRLLNCQRGQYGTKPGAYAAGSDLWRLADHGYQTLFPGWEMQEQMIQNLADFFNETGVAQLDFDGHEGLYCTGYGDYGTNYFVDAFQKKVAHQVFNGSSIMNHYYWHNNSYINWGEPWYASFRESQSEHRFRLQPFFERNYMPNMLGWFLVTPSTAVEDVEWMMSISAGYHAGYALVMSHEAYKTNPEIDKIIETIAVWEDAKRRGIFNAEQRALLKDPRSDFHLSRRSEQEWLLRHYDKFRFEHQKQAVQPGAVAQSTWSFENKEQDRSFRLQLTLEGALAHVEELDITIDNYFSLKIPVTLEAGQSIVWDSGTTLAKCYSDKGKLLQTIALEKQLPPLNKGTHQMLISAKTMTGDAPVIRGVVRLQGKEEVIRRL